MKLEKIALRGVTRFREPYELDLRGLGRLVALAGPNGRGKTTIMEAVPGALFKRLPSRSSLYDACHGRDAYIEATFVDLSDHRQRLEYRVRVQIDAEHRTAEQYVFRDGEPLTTGRSREHAAAVEYLFGSEALLLSSVFAAQEKDRSFLKIARSERKALLVEMLGLGHLEQLALEARQRGDAATVSLTVVRAKLDGLRQELAAGETVNFQVAEAKAALEKAGWAEVAVAKDHAQAQARHVEAVKAHEAAKGLREALKSAQRARDEVSGRKDRAAQARARLLRDHEARLASLRTRREAAEALVGQAGDIRVAVERVEARRQALEAHAKAVVEVARRRAEVAGEGREANAKTEAAAERVQAAKAQLGELQRRAELIGRAPCAIADGWIPEVEPPGPGRLDLRGTCPLLADARDAQEAISDCERQLEVARNGYSDAKRVLADARKRYADIKDAPDTAGGWDPADEALAAKAGQLEAAQQTLAQAATDLAQAQVAHAERLKEADEEESAAGAAYVQAHLLVADCEGRVSTSTEKEVDHAKRGLDDAERALERARADSREAGLALARLEERRQRLDAVAADVESEAVEEGRLATEAGDWTLLSRALGKDGVQALEVDAAGPEVARICNELLEACYGPRFSLSFETLREKKSKPGEYIEAFDVLVRDGVEERQVEALSGGEKVIVGEALGLAIAVFNARKNAVQWRTLFRDETAGALDPDNAIRYVDMLRRALDLGGFEQCLFVSHSPDVVNRADLVVRL